MNLPTISFHPDAEYWSAFEPLDGAQVRVTAIFHTFSEGVMHSIGEHGFFVTDDETKRDRWFNWADVMNVEYQ